MQLWILEIKGIEGYDWQLAVIVRALTPRAARKLAAETAGDEGEETWLDASFSSCRRVREEGKPGLILRDFNAG